MLFDRGEYVAATAGFDRVMQMVEREPDLGSDLARAAASFATLSREHAERDAARLFTANDAGVAPPVIVGSLLPAAPPPGTPASRLDVLELVIDAGGSVEKARLLTSANHYRNRWWVSAAKTWRFRPAMKGDHPVRFVVRLPIADGSDQP